jgi:HD-GYP domain-containing protein (c-di-GMP phosphodiesterase class II)
MPTNSEYAELPTVAVRAMTSSDVSDVEVYLPQTSGDAPVLYRKSGANLAKPDFERIKEHGVDCVLVRTEDLAACEQSLEARLGELVLDDSIPPPEKTQLLHAVSVATARELTRHPVSADRTARLARVIESTMVCVLNDPRIGAYMLKSAGHQRSLASHMQIVSTLSILLAGELFGEDHELLHDIGLAGMLHDIGKLSIPAAILDKPGRLSPDEHLLVQQHPIESVRLLGDDPTVSTRARQMILQHHERVDGRGYPLGISGSEIHPGSRILCIVDSFHALIGHRSYRSSCSVAEANRKLQSVVDKQFDKEYFECWLDLCERCRKEDNSDWRLPPDQPQADEVVAGRHEHRSRKPREGGVPRRRPRLQCPENTSVRCVYAGRLLNATTAPDEFAACVQDISCGGICIFSAHPMFRGEILHVRLRTTSETIWVRSMVCWCRPEDLNTYRVGLRFVKRVPEAEIGEELVAEVLGGVHVPDVSTYQSNIADDNTNVEINGDKRNDALQRLAAIAASRKVTREGQRMALLLSTSSDFVVRERSIEVLAGINSPTTREGLFALLGDIHPQIRERAAIAVGMAKITEASMRLRELLCDDVEVVAIRAAGALGQLGDWSGLPLIMRLLKEDGPHIRLAVRAFGDITGQRFTANREGLASARRYLKAKQKEFARKVKECTNTA